MQNIDANGLWDSLTPMARIGATNRHGVSRLALTDLDKESRDFFLGTGTPAVAYPWISWARSGSRVFSLGVVEHGTSTAINSASGTSRARAM
jgi:hypothetical protein